MIQKHDLEIQGHKRDLEALKINYGMELGEMRSDIVELSETMNSNLKELIDSNSFLRTQNTQILNQIIVKQNDEFELKKMKWGGAFKLSLALLTSGGAVYLIVELIIWLFKNR